MMVQQEKEEKEEKEKSLQLFEDEIERLREELKEANAKKNKHEAGSSGSASQ